MNPGGVRADFMFASSGTPSDADGLVTYEEAFTVQPFNNLVTTQTFTGAQLLDVLKDQWCGTNTARDGAAAVGTAQLHLRPVGRRRDPRRRRAPGPRTRSAA